MNQVILSLFMDCLGLKHRRIRAANNPKTPATRIVIIRTAKTKPPYLYGFSAREGDRLLRPAMKIQSKIPPNAQRMIA